MRQVNAAKQLKIYFVRNDHIWVDISNGCTYNKSRCEKCGLIAMQDKGSLEYFVVEGEANCASLKCEELIIKNIIE